MLYGNKVKGRLQHVPQILDLATGQDVLTKPGEAYELQFLTETPVAPENEAILVQQIVNLETQVADLKIESVEFDNEKVSVQIRDLGPGSISLAGLLSAMPAVFIIVGIGVIGYILYQILQSNPLLLWGLGVIVAGITFFYFLGDKGQFTNVKTVRTKGISEDKDKSKKIKERQAQLKQQSVEARALLREHRIERDTLGGEIKDVKAKIGKIEAKEPATSSPEGKNLIKLDKKLKKLQDALEKEEKAIEKYRKRQEESETKREELEKLI